MSAPAIEVCDASFAYGATVALGDVRFAARRGERVAVLGPNGGGKTTLFRGLTRELAPVEGCVRVRGRVGVVAQTERTNLTYPVSALDVATLGALGRLPWWRRPGRAERRAALVALERVGLGSSASRTYGALSGGQRQRVLIARALVQDVQVLLMDEPFRGLDASSAASLDALVDELVADGRTVLLATHDLEQARASDLVLCLDGRQVAFGTPADVLVDSAPTTYGASCTSC